MFNNMALQVIEYAEEILSFLAFHIEQAKLVDCSEISFLANRKDLAVRWLSDVKTEITEICIFYPEDSLILLRSLLNFMVDIELHSIRWHFITDKHYALISEFSEHITNLKSHIYSFHSKCLIDVRQLVYRHTGKPYILCLDNIIPEELIEAISSYRRSNSCSSLVTSEEIELFLTGLAHHQKFIGCYSKITNPNLLSNIFENTTFILSQTNKYCC